MARGTGRDALSLRLFRPETSAPRYFREALLLLGIDPDLEVDPFPATRAVESRLGRQLPATVVDLLRFPDVMRRVAEAYEGDAMFPQEVELVDSGFIGPEDGPVLWLLTENQGVCAWGVPLDRGDDPPVLVGGSLVSGESTTVEFAPAVGAFVYAMAWDRRLNRGATPVLQAQAQPLDDSTLTTLRASYRELIETHGWPGQYNYRFEGEGGFKLALWAADAQCDWFLTADDADALAREATGMLSLSDLEHSLWSDDATGDGILSRLRAT